MVVLINLMVLPLFVGKANADTLTTRNLTISDSRAGNTGTTYDFAFTVVATTGIKQWNIKFCTAAGAYADACTTPTGIVTTGAAIGSDNVTGSGRTNTFGGNGVLQTVVTTPSTQSPTEVTVSYTGITNPTTTDTTFFARIITYSDPGTTEIDSGTVAAAILTTTSIAVTAAVDPALTFTVAAVNSGTVNGATINVTTSTAVLIPFGTLSSGSTKIAAHDLTVETNASGGYTTTVKATATPPLVDGSNNIDVFTGANSNPTIWSSPGGTANSVNTGFFGYTTNDATLGTGTADRFTDTGNEWAGTTTSPLEVAFSATGVSSEITRVGWQAEVNSIQAPGSYTGTVILTTTPTY